MESSYGRAHVGTIGETNVSIRIDEINHNVNILIVSNHNQDVPVIVGLTFHRRSEVLTIVSGKGPDHSCR